jgi:hypothetical protein
MNWNPTPTSARDCRRAMIAFIIAGLSGSASLANWEARPIEVHEWGVNTFDWNDDQPLQQDLPGYFYTDKKPGTTIAPPEQRVRDLPADGGVRTKPILYFYPDTYFGMDPSGPQVGIEMRFAEGYANAWWPQVTRYRPLEVSARAVAPDWDAWKAEMLALWEERILGNNRDGKAAGRWNDDLQKYQALDSAKQIEWLARQDYVRRGPKFPEDGRMQLVWEKLTLHPELPEGMALPGKELPDGHWAKLAREVDAAYVSNGQEAERYVFYEGKTREEPAIALLPAGGAGNRRFLRGPVDDGTREAAVVNVSKHPIYDVIAVYRNREKGILWTGHVAMLPPRTAALRIPDFSRPKKEDDLQTSPEDFRNKTTGRLLEALTAGIHYDAGGGMMRDPADPQPATQLHQLFPKEALGLEKIWHDDFFAAEGMTVIYRESPAYLDEAMPLNLFTSMYWYIRLSRCGLVLNRNLPLEEVYPTETALFQYEPAHSNDHLKEDLEKTKPQLTKSRFLTLGQARYHLPEESPYRDPFLEEIRAFFK